MSEIAKMFFCAIGWHFFIDKSLEVNDKGNYEELPKCKWCGYIKF